MGSEMCIRDRYYFDSAFCLLDNILSNFNLFQVVQEPTSTGGATLINLALVSNLEALESCSVIPPLASSDHNGISLTMNLRKPSCMAYNKEINLEVCTS